VLIGFCLLYAKVNGVNVESLSHDEAVMVLKKAGDNVALRVRYFQPASYFLTTKGELPNCARKSACFHSST